MNARARGGAPTKRLKYAVQLRRARAEVEERPYVGLENIEPETGKLVTNGTTDGGQNEIESLGNAFEPGDVLFGKLRPYLAKVWLAEFAGRCTGELLVMQPKEFDARFLRAVCLNCDFIDAVDGSTFGSKMPRADWDFIGNMRVPVPPMPEQRAIADFLDRETARLDALVAAKARWLELLAEKRRALITGAVTKGLNPSAPMKPSGIEWLDEVPAHWDTSKRMKYVSSLKGRLGWQGLKAEEYTDEGPFVVSSAHFDHFGIIWEACPHVSNERYEMDSNIQLAEGDVLLMKDGAALGKLAYVTHLPHRACLNSHLLLFRSLNHNGNATYESSFLFYLMQTDFFQEHVKTYATGTTFLGISQEEIGNYRIALPPLDEQRVIVAHISAATAKLDALRAATERTIGLLQERRAALIAATVTGIRQQNGKGELL